MSLGFPADAKTPLKSHDGGQIALGILFFLLDLLVIGVLFSIVFWAYRFIVDLGIYGRCQDELEVLRRGWESFKANLWPSLAVPMLTNFLVTFMT